MEGEGVEEPEWVIILGAVLEYGRTSSVVRQAGGFGGVNEGTNVGSTGVKIVVKRATTTAADEETKADIDSGPDLKVTATAQASPAMSDADEAVSIITDEYPAPFKLAVHLTFSMLSHVLKNPTRKASPFALNPKPVSDNCVHIPHNAVKTSWNTCNPQTAHSLGRTRQVLCHNPPKHHGLPRSTKSEKERLIMLTSSCAPPSEDWCLRGMEWVGRRVFERGYWKSGEKTKGVEVLDASKGEKVTDGIIEDEDEDESASSGSGGETSERWARIVMCDVGIAQAIDGFKWLEGTRDWRIEGTLERKVQMWKEEARTEQRPRRDADGGRGNNAMEMDEQGLTVDLMFWLHLSLFHISLYLTLSSCYLAVAMSCNNLFFLFRHHQISHHYHTVATSRRNISTCCCYVILFCSVLLC